MITDYLYLIGVIAGLPLFIHAYITRKDFRKRMLVIGAIVGIVGILSESHFFQDYWQPPLIYRFGPYGGPEDFIFGFILGGWGSVIYEVYLKRRLRSGMPHHYWIVPLIIISEYLFVRFRTELSVNSIYASTLGLLVPILIIILVRKDLLHDALFSGLIFGGVLVLYETVLLFIEPDFLQKYFLLLDEAPLLGKAPLTELVWGVSAGALIGVFYEFFAGKRFVRIVKKR